MSESPRALTIQLLAWLAEKPRTYEETMEAWRTSCPRLAIWEDACCDELVSVGATVMVTDRGRAMLDDATFLAASYR
jgi:hypothetical protein